MAATTPQKKSRPKFKLGAFRDLAVEAKGMSVGVDLDLEAGKFDPSTIRTIGDPADFSVVEVAEGDVVHVPHPLLLDDTAQDRFDAFQQAKDVDQEEYTDPDTGAPRTRAVFPLTIDGREAPNETYRMAAAILGEDELHRLLAGGGHSNDVALAWQWLTAQQENLNDPKRPTPRR